MADFEKVNPSEAKPKSFKCKDCEISFPDVYGYTEHLESKAHVKGVMKKKYGEKYLEAKAKLENITPTPSQHAPIGNEHGTSGSEASDEDSNVYPCEVCKKVCTGYLSYKLHIQGRKHNKAVLKASLLSDMKDQHINVTEKKPKDELEKLLSQSHAAQTEIMCEICNKSCSGPEAYKKHMNSKSHLKKLLSNDIITGMESIGLAPKTNNGTEEVHYCETCKKGFSGPIPYLQHIKSPIHLKQEKQNEMRDKFKDLVTTSEEDTKIYCTECGKTFSGPIPFKDHLNSSMHDKLKKKNTLLENLEKEHPELYKGSVDDEDSDTDITLGCKVCHKVFSGPEAAKDHFNSSKHKKAVKQKALFLKHKNQMVQKKKEVVNLKTPQKTSKNVVNDEVSNDSSDEFEVISKE